MLTAERARELFDYDPDTGDLTWKVSLNPRAPAGWIVNTKHGDGYYSVRVDRKTYLAHRVAWLIVYGEWPDKLIDHVNGDRRDNRLSNLRKATYSENGWNCGVRASNTSGFKGVCKHNKCGKWIARIRIGNGVRKHLGLFDTPEAAHAAYRRAAEEHHGAFYLHGVRKS